METLILKPADRNLFSVQPQRSHPMTLRRVLFAKFLRWIDSLTPHQFRKVLSRLTVSLSIVLVVCVPQFFFGIMTDVTTWHGFALPKMAMLFVAFTYWRLALRWSIRQNLKRGNQHTYHGLPIDELASFLCEHKQFIRDEAMRRFAISQAKHSSIADELERHQVLVRGPNNARVLNEMTREQLARQLREDFPLAFADGEWVEKRGSYHHFLRQKERDEQRDQERIDRLERKRDRLKREIDELEPNPFHVQAIAL